MTTALAGGRWLVTPGRVALVAGALAAGGCQGRQLTVHPDPAPGAGTWLAAGVAGGGAALVLGLLVTLPAWKDPPGARWVGMVLGVQTGGLLVAAAITGGIAIRSQQLTQRADEPPAVALLELSAIGDAGFANVLVVGTLLFLLLPALITGLAAHLATSQGVAERWVACVVLLIQVGVGVVGVGRLLVGDAGLVTWLVIGNAPVAALAASACRPERAPAPRRPPHPAPPVTQPATPGST